MQRRCNVGILVVLVAGLGWADAPRALFRASFDGSLDGRGPAAEVVPGRQPEELSPGAVGRESAGTATFTPGRSGQALVCADGFRVAYPSAGHIRRDEGTVELWVRPDDWYASTEKRHHVFFEMTGPHCWLTLYRYCDPGRGLFFLINDNTRKNWQIAEVPIAWEPGQWHHLAIGWSRAAALVRLHLDGVLARELTFPVLPFPSDLPETFTVGDSAWGDGLKHSTTIDEVIIWDRLLSPARLALHAQGDLAQAPPLSADSVFLRAEAEGDGERWHYELRLLEGPPDAAALRAEVRVAAGGAGTPPVWHQEFGGGLVPGPTGGTIDLTAAAPGEYTLSGRLLDGATLLAEFSRPIWKLDPAWQREQVPTDRVLPPWTPVTSARDGTALRLGCWGRTYSYHGGLLPAEITSQGEALTAAPCRLEASFAGGQAVTWTLSPVADPVSKPHLASLRLVAESAGLAGTAQVTLEPDGALFTDLALSGARMADLDTLALVLPLRGELVRTLHRIDLGKGGVNAVIGPQDGTADQGQFNPYLWIGGDRRGLAFCCDSNRAWPNSLKPDAFQVVRQGGQVLLRLNLLKTGQRLPQPWHFRFGLLATPVKPWPADWRRGRIQVAEKPTIWVVWPNEQQWKMFGHPDFRDPAAMKDSFAASWKQGIRPIQYTTLHQLSAAAPEWQVYGQRWALVGGWNDTFCEMNLKTPFMACCAPAGWGDFWAWRLAKAVRDYDLGGLYFDNCFLAACGNTGHGHGPWTDGVYDVQIEALRTAYRRLYAAVKDQHADGVVVQHMSGQLNLFLQAYADYALDGEHLQAKAEAADGHYTQLLTLDEIRAEYMGRPGGVAPLLLPKLPSAVAYDALKGPARTREMMALLLLHDIQLWAAYCHYETVTGLQKVLDRFGWLQRADFLPYLDPNCPVTAAGREVYVSVYARPENKAAVAVVANLRAQNVRTHLTAQLGGLGLPETAVARDAETGAAIGPAAACDLVVRSLDLRLVYLAAPDAPPLWETAPSAASALDRAERAGNGDFETVARFDPTAGGWPQESVAKGWKIGPELPVGWAPHPASQPGELRVLRGPEAHAGQAALRLAGPCLVGGSEFAVKAGQVFRVAFWARGSGEAFISGAKYARREGKTSFLRTEPLLAAHLTPEWTSYVGAFRPTADVDSVALILQTGTANDQVAVDDVSIRQVSEIEGRILDSFGALRQAGRYCEPDASVPAAALEAATAELAKAREELAAALAQNPDSGTQALALQIAAAAPGEGAAPAERANALNALALLAHEAAAGLSCVDVRSEGK